MERKSEAFKTRAMSREAAVERAATDMLAHGPANEEVRALSWCFHPRNYEWFSLRVDLAMSRGDSTAEAM